MARIDAGWLVAGRYQLEARLDSGGRAQVWSATDKELNRTVAVKLLLMTEHADPGASESFRQEARTEARLKHPNIAEVFDWGQADGFNYEVLELLDGQSIRRWLQNGVFTPARVVTIGRRAAAALAYAHDEGVAHGNVGPDRVMVGSEDRTTLIDFGLPCRGNCEYPALPDADTYALGGLLYEMLTGVSPFGAPPAVLAKRGEWPESVRKLSPETPHDLERVVMKAIAADPASRYQSAGELQSDLDALARPKRTIWPWALAAALAVVAVAAGTWFLASQTKAVIPDVTGMASADASSALSSAGLRMVAVGQATSPNLPVGAVVSENPPAGSKARRGSQVGVVLSIGKPTTTVPSVTGLTLQAASSAVASQGLVVGTVTKRNSTTFPDNTVISQTPAAGVRVKTGGVVSLVVSGGVQRVTVPDVGGLSQAAATTKLEAAGLVVDVARVYSAQPAGSVVTQGPTAGTTVAAGDTVTIAVSRGAAPVRVPDVVGAQEADAKASLQDLGLVPVTLPATGDASQVGIVLSQSPGAGARVAPGSQVQIHVGQ